MKKTFNISTIDSVLFLGPKDQNIKLIENSFTSKIVVRGSNIIVDGVKKEIEMLNVLIDDMIITINKKGFVDCLYRRFKMTAEAVVDKFGIDLLPVPEH